MPALVLFLLLIGVPLAELFLLIEAGGAIGVLPTIGLCVATAVAGAAILKAQGRDALDRLRADIEAERPPVEPAVHGALLLAAAPLLLTPGFMTDALGFLLLVPPVRVAIGRRALRWLRGKIDRGELKAVRIVRY